MSSALKVWSFKCDSYTSAQKGVNAALQDVKSYVRISTTAWNVYGPVTQLV